MRLVKYAYFIFSILLVLGISLKSIGFLDPDFEQNSFLASKEHFFDFYKWPLYAHIFSASLAITLGMVQFSTKLGTWHKYLGMGYVLSVMFIASPSALIMSFTARGGISGSLSFALLSILWFYFTLQAYKHARKKAFTRHKAFMIRSFVLANSAILLRLLGFLNIQFSHWDIQTAYPWFSWMSWLPSLLIYEWVRSKKNRPLLPDETVTNG